MKATAIKREPRDNGMVDVTIAMDGTRFTVSVPAALDASEDAGMIYQQMANSVVRQVNTLRSIVDSSRLV